MYPVLYLRNKTTTGVLNPRPTVKLVGTMVQDSLKKKKKNRRERKAMYQRETNKSTCY